MIESLTEHLNLDDRIKGAVSQFPEDFFAFICVLSTMNFSCIDASLLVEATNLSGVVDRAGDSNQLMR
ncbi:hypothetical protein BJF82_08755 [Kytococcus sp. CUA-901]|nr:hypothetical protein BJF82_08755 [Kytococcus sp. CUA-901]